VQDWKEDGTAGYDPRVMYSTGGPICLVQLETTYFLRHDCYGRGVGGSGGGGGRGGGGGTAKHMMETIINGMTTTN
jgi:hypothetical protein